MALNATSDVFSRKSLTHTSGIIYAAGDHPRKLIINNLYGTTVAYDPTDGASYARASAIWINGLMQIKGKLALANSLLAAHVTKK